MSDFRLEYYVNLFETSLLRRNCLFCITRYHVTETQFSFLAFLLPFAFNITEHLEKYSPFNGKVAELMAEALIRLVQNCMLTDLPMDSHFHPAMMQFKKNVSLPAVNLSKLLFRMYLGFDFFSVIKRIFTKFIRQLKSNIFSKFY